MQSAVFPVQSAECPQCSVSSAECRVQNVLSVECRVQCPQCRVECFHERSYWHSAVFPVHSVVFLMQSAVFPVQSVEWSVFTSAATGTHCLLTGEGRAGKCNAMQLIPMLFGSWSSHCFYRLKCCWGNNDF